MATTGERLVAISTLTTGSALDHFLNISTGTGDIRVYAKYPVVYIGAVSKEITYIKPKNIPIAYVEPKKLTVKYVGTLKADVIYIPRETIKVKLICKQ